MRDGDILVFRIFIAVTDLHGDSLADPDGVPHSGVLGPALQLRKRGHKQQGARGRGEAFEKLNESRYVLVCVLEDVCEVIEKLRNRWGFIVKPLPQTL